MNPGIMSAAIHLCTDPGGAASYQVDAAYTFGTSGKAVFYRFVSPVSQTSGNLTAYFFNSTTATGSPTYKCELRNGPPSTEPDRPESGGSQLAVTADVSPTAVGWYTFSMTGVTLVAGQQYYLIAYNTHGTPASNYTSWATRGAADGHMNPGTTDIYACSGYTADGFTTDPTITTTNHGTAVVKFNSGDVMGFPYVGVDAAHANNSNHRGNRINLPCAVTYGGQFYHSTSATGKDIRVYQGSTQIVSTTLDYFSINRPGGTLAPDTALSANTDYDVVLSPTANTTFGTVYNMGVAEGSVPADVLAARPQGVLGYVDGATPGSLTLDTSKIMRCSIILAFAAGGGGRPEFRGGNL